MHAFNAIKATRILLPHPGARPGGDRRGVPGRLGKGRNGRALAVAALALAVTAGLLAAQLGGWIGAPSGDGGAAVPDAWPPSGDTALAGLLPGYAFAQSVTQTLNLTAAGSIDDSDGTLELEGATGIAVFESGGGTYAAVAAFGDFGVQILDITDPSNVTAAGSIGDAGALELDSPYGIATFESGGSTYAAVASFFDDGVQILNVTDPFSVTAAGSIDDGDGTFELDGARNIAIFESGGGTYAAVAAQRDNGVQILNITDPSNVTAAGSIGNTGTLELNGPYDIATFTSGGGTYAAVASFSDDSVQILDVTDPSNVTAAGSIDDSDGTFELDGASGIAVFESGSGTYAAVAAYDDDGVQILNITDPFSVTAAGSINGTALELDGASGIAVFESGGSTYAAVASSNDNGVQILRLTVVSDPFLTTWETVSANQAIGIPVEVHSGGTLNIDWGDGNTTTVSANGTQSHTYAAADSYRVAMTGDLSRINLAGSDSTPALLHSINQWGDIKWSTMNGAFRGATAMTYNATDAPDLSQVADMSSMFRNTGAFNGDISAWNTSSVTSMSNMFTFATAFNKDISTWNTSSVTDMTSMFLSAGAFNGDISTWNTSSVANMAHMFHGAGAFNGNLSTWGTSSVTDMSSMFNDASAFNGNLSTWNTSSVTGMTSMFLSAGAFNGDISTWNTSSVTGMFAMFRNAAVFNGDISTWNTSQLLAWTTCSAMPPHLTETSPPGTPPQFIPWSACSTLPSHLTETSLPGMSRASPTAMTCPTCSAAPMPLSRTWAHGTLRRIL